MIFRRACFVFLLAMRAAAFGQPLSVPAVQDFGDVPVEEGIATLVHHMRVFGVTNTSNENVTLLSVDVPHVNILPDVLRFEVHSDPSPLTYTLAPNQIRYYAVAFNGTDTGSFSTTVTVRFMLESGSFDSVEFPMLAHAVNSPAPFVTEFQAGTIFLCRASDESPGAGGWVALFNPSDAPLRVDSITMSGDTSDFIISFQRTTDTLNVLRNVVCPFTIRPHGSQVQLGIAFVPNTLGAKMDTLRIYTTSSSDGPIVYQTVFGGDVQYSPQLSAIGDFDNIVYTNIPPDSCSGAQQMEVHNCGDTVHVTFALIGQHRKEFSMSRMADTTVIAPGEDRVFNVQFCPSAARPWEYDSVMVIGTYPAGNRDTVYVQIYSSVLDRSSVEDSPVSSALIVYPNPFASSTHIHLDQPLRDVQRVSVFDLIGREVVLLATSPAEAREELEWNPNESHLPLGAYVLVVRTISRTRTWRLLYVR